jgi:hypothetical protein
MSSPRLRTSRRRCTTRFLRLLSSMVEVSDGHVTIKRSSTDPQVIFDLRVVDSSFAIVETENQTILEAFDSRLTGARRS